MVISQIRSLLVLFLLIFSVLAYNVGYAHPGRTDANGGHYNRRTGEYHKHVKKDSQSDETDTDPVVTQDTIASDINASELKVAAWNIRIMSNKSRTDAELMAIARTLADYDFIDLTAGSLSGGGYQYEWNGITKIWRCPFTTMQEYHKSGKLYYTRNGTPRLKQFLDDMPGVPVQDVWIDIPPINSQAKERVGYPT